MRLTHFEWRLIGGQRLSAPSLIFFFPSDVPLKPLEKKRGGKGGGRKWISMEFKIEKKIEKELMGNGDQGLGEWKKEME